MTTKLFIWGTLLIDGTKFLPNVMFLMDKFELQSKEDQGDYTEHQWYFNKLLLEVF